MTIVKTITKDEIKRIVEIGCKNFKEDVFYNEYSKKKDDNAMSLLFEKSATICLQNGVALKVEVDNKIVGFLLGFNYYYLKENYFKQYNHFFVSRSVSNLKKLQDVQNLIEHNIPKSNNNLYILAVAVDEEYRNQGFATKLIDYVCEEYSHYNIFADISNNSFISTWIKKGFEVIDKTKICDLVYKESQFFSDSSQTYLAVPEYNDFFDVKYYCGDITLKNVVAKGNGFVTEYNNETNAKLYKIDKTMLLKYQRQISVITCIERIIRQGKKDILYYIVSVDTSNDCSEKYIEKTSDLLLEKDINYDIVTTIPMTYSTVTDKFIVKNSKSAFNTDLLIDALSLRTEFESGIPMVKDVEERGYRDRIKRFNLGRILIQLKEEQTITFSKKQIVQNVGKPIEFSLILSIDKESEICVLHMVCLSCKEKVSQYLDSVSRNQIIVKDGQREINIFSYLKEKYGLTKYGVTKNFITCYEFRNYIKDAMLASILLGEAYYGEDESEIGEIVQKDVIDLVKQPNGFSTYNYANVYAYSNTLFQTSENLSVAIKDRVSTLSLTLQYIEIVCFEESAITLANSKIISYLTKLQNSVSNNLLNDYGEILIEYANTADFWDVNMNFESSKIAIEHIKAKFGIEKVKNKYNKDLEVFKSIFEAKSDYIDKRESAILTTIGAVLTVISVIELALDSSSHLILGIAGAVVGLFLFLKNKIYNRKKNRGKKR